MIEDPFPDMEYPDPPAELTPGAPLRVFLDTAAASGAESIEVSQGDYERIIQHMTALQNVRRSGPPSALEVMCWWGVPVRWSRDVKDCALNVIHLTRKELS